MKQMNSEEKRMLSFLKDTEDLTLYGKEALRQLRMMEAFLKEKYPSAEMEYRYFEPYVRTVEKGVLVVSLKDSEICHKVIIRKTSKGDVCMDDIYGELIRKDYDESRANMLYLFTGPLSTYTVFFTLTGTDVDENNMLTMAREHRPSFGRHTDVFVHHEPEISDLLKFHLAENGYYGSYTVYRVSEDWIMPADISARYENVKELMTFRISESDYESGEIS